MEQPDIQNERKVKSHEANVDEYKWINLKYKTNT